MNPEIKIGLLPEAGVEVLEIRKVKRMQKWQYRVRFLCCNHTQLMPRSTLLARITRGKTLCRPCSQHTRRREGVEPPAWKATGRLPEGVEPPVWKVPGKC